MDPRTDDEIYEHETAYRWQPYTAEEIEAIERAIPEARRLAALRPPMTAERRAEAERLAQELKITRAARDARRATQA